MTATRSSPSRDELLDVAAPGADARATVVPLVEENLDVERQATQIGALRVRVAVEEASEHVAIDLVREEVRPTVRRVGTPASERRGPYLDGDEVVIPVYEERVVVERRLFRTEEIRLGRARAVEREEREVPLRRERAVLERQQADGSWREVEVAPGAPVADDMPSAPDATPMG